VSADQVASIKTRLALLAAMDGYGHGPKVASP
jgi:hypothetical protein